MTVIELTLQTMANGGSAMGYDEDKRAVFIPYTIPGETVKAKTLTEKRHFIRAELIEVLQSVPDRVEPRCPHFGVCGGCHFQHMSYAAQVKWKRSVVADQLERIGKFKGVTIRPLLPNPTPWQYNIEVNLSPTPEGGLGFWAPAQRQVIPIETCHIIHPQLLELWQDMDLSLPGLRKLTLRIGDDEAMLAAFEVNDVEPPDLAVDFPLSVAIVLPDRTSASLVGDNYIVQRVKEWDFRISPGCFFQSSIAGAEMLVDAVLQYAQLSGNETVLEGFSGVGMLTAFLAQQAGELTAVEINPDAIADTAVNLADLDNVSLYEGNVATVLPMLDIKPDVVVVNPTNKGLETAVSQAITALKPKRIIYVSADIATLARDGRELSRGGYKLVEVQPIDMAPQTFQIDTVSLWQHAS